MALIARRPCAHDLVARHDIENALSLHSRGVDRADAALIAASYHDDATVDYGFFDGVAADLATILSDAQKDTPPTAHRTGHCWIAVDGERAVSESYVIAYAEDAMQRLIFGRYLDRHECRSGEWRIVHRQYVMAGNMNAPSTVSRPGSSADFAGYAMHGAKRASDPGRGILNHFANRITREGNPMTKGSTDRDDARLDAALSRAEIHDLCAAYCRGVDRADKALLLSVFLPDAPVSLQVTNGTARQFAEDICRFVVNAAQTVFHSIANEWIEVSGDHGVGELYVIAAMIADGRETLTGGRYLDRYERRDGRWYIAERAFITDWNSTRPSTMQHDGLYETLPLAGRADRSDPVYDLWASLEREG
ncbi:nuclear transport factor 2 family protein [Croceicoccus hydrothermalis]|uniref:nuclear transport factor 2 family protein n=1 Tax=Croceicoccus hydrothermalis TaxID=2867964 RepID=UPI001EFB1629|nr:nuclear transport factor 2 family protein [Croceicoccus hydrothermalis]